MVEKIYHAYVKHIEHTVKSMTEVDLEVLLTKLADWRKEESNQNKDYDLYIKDQYGNLIFGSRF